MVYKIFFIALGLLIFAVFFLPIFHKVINFGNIAGMLLGGGISAIGLLWNKIPQNMEETVQIIIFVVIVALITAMDIVLNSGKTTATDEDVIIILGCRVKGEQASLSLEKRVDSAYRFLMANPHSVAILSGGQGKDEDISEAECMRRILAGRGINSNRLIVEDKSTSTDENIQFSLERIEQLGLGKRVAVATSEYHQKRAKLICERYGLSASAQSSKTMAILLPTFLLREVAGLLKENLHSRK